MPSPAPAAAPRSQAATAPWLLMRIPQMSPDPASPPMSVLRSSAVPPTALAGMRANRVRGLTSGLDARSVRSRSLLGISPLLGLPAHDILKKLAAQLPLKLVPPPLLLVDHIGHDEPDRLDGRLQALALIMPCLHGRRHVVPLPGERQQALDLAVQRRDAAGQLLRQRSRDGGPPPREALLPLLGHAANVPAQPGQPADEVAREADPAPPRLVGRLDGIGGRRTAPGGQGVQGVLPQGRRPGVRPLPVAAPGHVQDLVREPADRKRAVPLPRPP